MKRTILAILCLTSLCTSLPASALTLAHFWSQRYGDANDQVAIGAAADASGNVYLIGYFQGTVNFGGGDLTSPGGNDGFVAKFNSAGVHQWSKHFDTASGGAIPSAVATDASGNVWITGNMSGTVDFGGGGLVGAGGQDVFLVKFNSAGVHQWSQRFGDASDQYGFGLATGASGDVYMVGIFAGSVSFSGGPPLTSAGSYDAYVVKFNATGGYQWSQRFGDANYQNARSAATDASGAVYISGYFTGSVDFGGGALTSQGLDDAFLVKFSSTGVHQWSQRFGDSSDQYCNAVATDALGNVYITGHGGGTLNFGGGNLTTAGGWDTYLAKFNSNGAHQWSHIYGDASDQVARVVATDASGNVYLAGFFAGTVDFGGGSLASAGARDVFLAKFDPAGAHQWSQRFGDAAEQYAYALAADPLGGVYEGGYFQGAVDLGGGNLTSAGVDDIFLARFVAGQPVMTSIADIGNDQGRQVRIRFSKSGLDASGSSAPVTEYEVYRRKDALPAAMAVLGAGSRGQLSASGWDFAGAVPAHGDPAYSVIAPTLADSTIAKGQHYSVFAIRAATPNPLTYFDSPADSGYSLDNLAPGIPTSFVYNSGVLSWSKSTADDFDYFSVYGAATNSFGSATLINYTTGLNLDVTGSPYAYYFVTATDFSGNESKPTVLNSLTGVGDTPRNYVLSISSYPNPFNPETTIRYTVPSKGSVTVAVYGANGARVAMLVDGTKEAGAYTQRWDGRDAGGRGVSSGVYFARVTHPSGTKSYKMVLLK